MTSRRSKWRSWLLLARRHSKVIAWVAFCVVVVALIVLANWGSATASADLVNIQGFANLALAVHNPWLLHDILPGVVHPSQPENVHHNLEHVPLGMHPITQAGRPPTPARLDHFVTVLGKQLWWHNKPFHFSGFNNYFMMTRAADEYTRARDVMDVFDAAARLNMTVMRTWAFADGAAEWNALQPRAGWYDQRILVRC